jgi:hypothetical protein
VASFGDFFAEKRQLDKKRTLTSTSVRVQRGGPASSLPTAHNQRSINAPSGPVWEITNKEAVPESPSLTVTRSAPTEPSSQDAPTEQKEVPAAPPAEAAPAFAAATQATPAAAPLDSPQLRRVPSPPLDAATPVIESKPDAYKEEPAKETPAKEESTKKDASSPRKRHGAGAAADGPIETLTYRDPFAGVYKKYIFSADGKYLLGGMMVGDTSDYVKLVALVKKKVSLHLAHACGGLSDQTLRKHSMCHRRSLFWAQVARAMTRVQILTMTRKFAAAM